MVIVESVILKLLKVDRGNKIDKIEIVYSVYNKKKENV
jgi:hypothetical protein